MSVLSARLKGAEGYCLLRVRGGLLVPHVKQGWRIQRDNVELMGKHREAEEACMGLGSDGDCMQGGEQGGMRGGDSMQPGAHQVQEQHQHWKG